MINQFTDVETFINWVEHQKRFSPKVGMAKMNYYCSLFDYPQKKFKSIHITGTNGKGSTVAFLRSIYQNAGYHVATFTSPYITQFNERIEFDGQNISDDDLVRIANKIIAKYPAIENDGYELPSFFEFITLLAFIYFSELSNLDLAIIEVGMGGRLDATNVIESEVAVISNIAFDHMNVLGDTLEKIAYEKLGIVKNHVPLVCGVREPSLQNYIKEQCDARGSESYFTFLTAFEIQKMDIYHSQILTNAEGLGEIEIGLAGKHQIENAHLAIKVVKILNQKGKFVVSDVLLKQGLKKAVWPGRLEVLNKEPLIITDGGHNIDAVTRICEFVKSLNYPSKRVVVAISQDKEKAAMLKLLSETFDEVVCTEYSYDRTTKSEVLYEMCPATNKKMFTSLNDALDYCFKSPVSLTIFMGSLYLVTDIRKLFE